MKYVLSYGGGVNSSALFFYLLEHDRPLDLVIFADTGEELPQTYEAVDRMKKICGDRGVEFVTTRSHHGKLYDYYFSKKAVPSIMRRDCTGKFKVEPIRKYLRERFGKKERFTMYIGIAWDEAHRLSESRVKYVVHSFPFIDDKENREDNEEILRRNGFQAEKSGCVGCPYIKKKGYMKLYEEDRGAFHRWKALELNCSAYPRVTLIPGLQLEKLEQALKEQTKLGDYGVEEHDSCGDCAGGCFL